MGKRILITGVGGFIGGALFSKLRKINPFGVDFALKVEPIAGNFLEVDLRDENGVKTLLNEYSPDTVFHFAALKSPRRNEENVSLAIELHLRITNNIVNNIHKDAHIIFLSTDKVFDGSQPCPDEEAEKRPQGVYGRLKLQCENIIKERLKRFHIFRLPIVHSLGEHTSLSTGAGPASFIDKAIADLRAGKQVVAFDNVQRCFLKLQDLLNLLEIVMDDTHCGIYHVGSRMMSYYDRLRFLCEENQINWKGKLTPKSGQASPLTQNLNSSKLKRIFDYTLT